MPIRIRTSRSRYEGREGALLAAMMRKYGVSSHACAASPREGGPTTGAGGDHGIAKNVES
jgi:hypothetical protein